MDSVNPADIVSGMIRSGVAKTKLRPTDLLIRGALAGGLLGIATTLALGAAVQTGQWLVGALIFPVGFIIIVLLGLDLLTGSFALLPMAVMARQATLRQMVANWSWVFIGNLIGSVLYGMLFVIAVTDAGHAAPAGVVDRIRQLAEAKTIGYSSLGGAGFLTVFVKAVLCNWMVCMGVVMASCSTSVVGRIAAAWMPILLFFAQGFEHVVVNFFVIPTGMILGAKVGMTDWVVWNLIPVALGNLLGGFLFVGLALFVTFGRLPAVPSPRSAEVQTLMRMGE